MRNGMVGAWWSSGIRATTTPEREEVGVILDVTERLTLLMALPSEGDLTTIRIVSKLREDLSFTEEEHAALGMVVEGSSARWNQEADAGREYEFGAKARDVITRTLLKLDKEGKLSERHLSLCDKFGIGED